MGEGVLVMGVVRVAGRSMRREVVVVMVVVVAVVVAA